MSDNTESFKHQNLFTHRHIGPRATDIEQMLAYLGVASVTDLMAETIPDNIRCEPTSQLAEASSEYESLAALKAIADRNKIALSFIGQGYHPTITPPVIQRNVLENPGWYTAYTPYQPEIAQGRLEGLLNFQQMAIDLSGLPLANASMLDESTAAAEAMAMSKRVARKNKSLNYLVDENVHPQTLAVVRTRAEHFGFEVIVGAPEKLLQSQDFFGVLLQYPGTDGRVNPIKDLIASAHQANAVVSVAADIMALLLLESPGHFGADIVVASTQRFGVPMGFGGPHAAFFAFREEYKRAAPGRIIGVSIDKKGKPALRMAMQTREQHIRREKANSNICTSQVLPALLSVFYAIYHGPVRLKAIANEINQLTKTLAHALDDKNYVLEHNSYFDTLAVTVDSADATIKQGHEQLINLRKLSDTSVAISIGETTDKQALLELFSLFGLDHNKYDEYRVAAESHSSLPSELVRQSLYLQHPVFTQHHSETELMRYVNRLEAKDIALNQAMIPLGSCTMKLNAAAEMMPISWPEFSQLHPFAPASQTQGYQQLISELEAMLAHCTGYDAISLQPNAGSQGEYAGLLAIKNYFLHRGETQRSVCLIPASAHGTNPASAQMAGLKVVVTACDSEGNVDLNDLKEKTAIWGDSIAALMITYPSTHGVFETDIRDICSLMHSVGAQVYIDGANLNALVGLAAPGEFGGDVSHLNLHKTFCIPHGGGGPGMGPIGVKAHLQDFLPGHPESDNTHNHTISAAPYGSASLLPISWMYLRMMGREGVKEASAIAILNANYVAAKLRDHYPILYTGSAGRVAHECLLDLRPIKEKSGISEEDIAKRLMDYGFHAPTMSFPVAGTLMIEPTESESLHELNRFCAAMINIRKEISRIEQGEWPNEDNPLVNAPHTLEDVLADDWPHGYSREQAARALDYLKAHKVWPSVNRIDNVYGDRNLQCSCVPISEYE